MRRLAQIDIAAVSPADAASTYERNFGLRIQGSSAEAATIAIGDTKIRLTPSSSPDFREGLIALWFEADDIGRLIEALKGAGITPGPAKIQDGRRVLAIDSRHTSGVQILIVDSKA
ncbi:MAG: VOC family protein [Candidatus Binataceae bacterium]